MALTGTAKKTGGTIKGTLPAHAVSTPRQPATANQDSCGRDAATEISTETRAHSPPPSDGQTHRPEVRERESML